MSQTVISDIINNGNSDLLQSMSNTASTILSIPSFSATAAGQNASSSLNFTAFNKSKHKVPSPPFLNASGTYVPTIVTSLINAVIAQVYDSDLPKRNLAIYTQYIVSPYALVCMLTAMILNRTVVFASMINSRHARNAMYARQIHPQGHNRSGGAGGSATNSENSGSVGVIESIKIFFLERKFPRWVKIFLRLTAIALLLRSFYHILICLNCYVPFCNKFLSNFEVFNYDPVVNVETNLAPINYGFVKQLLKENSTSVEKNVTMLIGKGGNLNHEHPTFGKLGPCTNFLWNLYLAICYSQFVETFCSVVSGNKPCVETSLTLFEHSIAFHEFTSIWDLSYFPIKPTPELLVMSVNSILNQLTIHVLRITNKMKWRLLILTVLGVSFISYYFVTFFNGRLIYFPLIVLMSYLPQAISLLMILTCSIVYFGAVLLSESDGSEDDEDNMHRVSFSNLINFENLNLNSSDDFNKALTKISVITLTTATKKSFVKELSFLGLPESSWLDEEISSFERALYEQQKKINQQDDYASDSNKEFSNDDGSDGSPYDNIFSLPKELMEKLEREAEEAQENGNGISRNNERRSWLMSKRYYKFIIVCKFFYRLLFSLVFRRRSIKLKKALLNRKNELLRAAAHNKEQSEGTINQQSLITAQELFSANGETINYDLLLNGPLVSEADDASDSEFDAPSNLSDDDYDDSDEPLEFDSEYESERESENEGVSSGFTTRTGLQLSDSAVKRKRSTPLKSSKLRSLQQQRPSKSNTGNDNLIGEIFDSSEIYSLLGAAGVHNEAAGEDSGNGFRFDVDFKKILSYHLSNDLNQKTHRPITRSFVKSQLASVLGGETSSLNGGNQRVETFKLMQLVMEKRKNPFADTVLECLSSGQLNKLQPDQQNGEAAEEEDKEEQGFDFSKQFSCVICQTNPRQIILWPCKCLAICENCRMSLVLRDFNSCVCCRREIKGYSKIFIP